MRIVQSWLTTVYGLPALAGRPRRIVSPCSAWSSNAIERPGKKYEGFVVGEVLDVQRHPKADRLTVCRVRTGKETLQIVCGAPNVAPGQKVPVGLVGATVPRNQHDPSGKPFVLSQVTLRGVESSGMICSAYELDLGKDADGILVLDAKAKVGQPLAAFLGMDDVVYDVEITPNRPDWLSHIGIAREIAVLTGKQPRLPKVAVREGTESIHAILRVRVEDPEHCPRFAVTDDPRRAHRPVPGVAPAMADAGRTASAQQCRGYHQLRHAGVRSPDACIRLCAYRRAASGHPARGNRTPVCDA